MRTSRRVKRVTIGVIVAAVLAGLVFLTAPLVVPFLPQQVQVAIGGTITTVPGTVDELLAATKLGPYRQPDAKVTHEDADAEYVSAASIWPWTLPPAWGFPENRGIRDDPGKHWTGMGVQAAFAMWAQASLEAVESGSLETDAANALLDDVEEATRLLLDEGVLSDRDFIEESVTPLRR